MIVKNLIELLKGLPQELEVYIPIDCDMVQMVKVNSVYIEELTDEKSDIDIAAVVIGHEMED